MSKAIMLGMAALVLAACNKTDQPKPASEKAAEAAGDRTLATGLGDNSKFAAAVKAAGLEAALAVRRHTPCWCPMTPPLPNCPLARPMS